MTAKPVTSYTAAAYRFAGFVLLPDDKQLLHQGCPVRLQPKAFDTLLLLVERHGRLVSKQDFLACVWPDTFVDDVVLPHNISQIRKILGDREPSETFIETVPKRGYRFVAPVDRLAAHQPYVEPLSVAVLPFANLDQEKESDYFSDGIAEEILTVLARDPALRVSARSSSFAFKNRPQDPAAIAERLGVDVLLEGSVLRAGAQVRITARLVEAADGSTWWSRTFARERTDVLSVQDEIALDVAATVRETLSRRRHAGAVRQAAARPVRRRPASPEAYEEYLKGQQLNYLRVEGMRQARSHFERAIALDPGFPQAYAGLAQSYCWLGVYGAMPSNEAFVGTRRHAERALDLDPTLAQAHHLLGYVALWFEWDAAACERHIARALSLQAHHADTLMLRAHLAIARRRVDEALASARSALAADPLGLTTRANSFIIAFCARDFARVIRETNELIAEYPCFSEAFRWKAMALSMQGDYGSAREVYEEAVKLSGAHPYSTLGLTGVLALQGHTEEARARLAALLERGEREWILPMGVAIVNQYLGDYEAALDWLERAYISRDFMMPMLHVWKGMEIIPPGRTTALCEEPRFQELVRRVGMAPDTH
jgi:TolB-like protein/Tfp pilus assembly protein PilF